jgi:superfamily I DNA/RNA helicase
LPNTLCIAGAGSGKTHKIITESIAEIERGGKVLVVTYTTSNQNELRNRFKELYGKFSSRFVVKGLFSFYLEDMVRPYQRALFQRRINEIFFNDRNPHLPPKSKFPYPGRQEQLGDKSYNPRHFLTACETKVHTGFLAKLVARIAKSTKSSGAVRLAEIYSRVYFDEVQDLVGWDYDVLKVLSKTMKSPVSCVGDFRQTVYETSFGHKKPQTAQEKIAAFIDMGFALESLPLNRRCIQAICNIADEVHKGAYEQTKSGVEDVPAEFAHHIGAFIVKHSDVATYVATYDPIVLRWQVNSGKRILPEGVRCYTFGSSKGLGFDRIMILPAESQEHFILDDNPVFLSTAETSQNKMYVAITRARYSIGFIVKDEQAEGLRFPVWAKP